MRSKETGAAVLVMAIILLVAAGFSIVFLSSYSQIQQNIAANQTRGNQAFFAAEAGLEYGLAYLQNNSATVIAGAVSGVLNYPLGSTTLSNGATYSVTFSNPTVSLLTLLTITSVGRSADGTATQTVSQSVNLSSTAAYTVTTQGNFTTSGTVIVGGANGVNSGGPKTTSGTFTGTFKQNDTALSSMSGAEFFNYMFGMTSAAMKAQSTYYANATSVPYASLSGIVWIDSNVTLSGGKIIGSATNPVLLIVNGNFTASGVGTVVNGYIYSMGNITTSGSFNVIGGMASQGGINMSGTSLTYNQAVMNRYLPGGGYAKVTGSWKDF